ncbi:hypothetical protein ACF1BP_23410, partial [Streptomyces sp. NPDC014735]|uniref:hypothetical protein n=1 Tax=Streptomyces sp. NPDC014735 TaxID=3364887 RepID=UPI0036F8A34E
MECEAGRAEAALGLAGHAELPSLALPAAGAQVPAGLARVAAGPGGPGAVSWLLQVMAWRLDPHRANIM